MRSGTCYNLGGVITELDEPRAKQWSREDYYRLAEAGYFMGKRVQLIDGEIIEMSPQGHSHAKSLTGVYQWLQSVFGAGYWVRIQMPLNVGRRSDPEPDVAIIEGESEVFSDHPTTALLVVEVSDSSLRLDRKKAHLYASAGVEEYWIVNLLEGMLEVYRDRISDAAAPFGHRYQSVAILAPPESVAPILKPNATLPVAKLLK